MLLAGCGSLGVAAKSTTDVCLGPSRQLLLPASCDVTSKGGGTTLPPTDRCCVLSHLSLRSSSRLLLPGGRRFCCCWPLPWNRLHREMAVRGRVMKPATKVMRVPRLVFTLIGPNRPQAAERSRVADTMQRVAESCRAGGKWVQHMSGRQQRRLAAAAAGGGGGECVGMHPSRRHPCWSMCACRHALWRATGPRGPPCSLEEPLTCERRLWLGLEETGTHYEASWLLQGPFCARWEAYHSAWERARSIADSTCTGRLCNRHTATEADRGSLRSALRARAFPPSLPAGLQPPPGSLDTLDQSQGSVETAA